MFKHLAFIATISNAAIIINFLLIIKSSFSFTTFPSVRIHWFELSSYQDSILLTNKMLICNLSSEVGDVAFRKQYH